MNIIKKFLSFLWNDLYNKKSMIFVNLYAISTTSLIIYDLKTSGYFTAYLFIPIMTINFIIYSFFLLIFFIEVKKKKKTKDNFLINNWVYKIISIISGVVAVFNIMVFIFFPLWLRVIFLFR